MVLPGGGAGRWSCGGAVCGTTLINGGAIWSTTLTGFGIKVGGGLFEKKERSSGG
jgi:hypothetical protein